MRRHHVAVLFHHRLFGEAIARLLREDERLDVTALPIDDTSAETLRDLDLDTIVVEDSPMGYAIRASLVDVAPTLTVVIGPEENVAEVYEKHEVIRATAEDIITRITAPETPRGKPSGE